MLYLKQSKFNNSTGTTNCIVLCVLLNMTQWLANTLSNYSTLKSSSPSLYFVALHSNGNHKFVDLYMLHVSCVHMLVKNLKNFNGLINTCV